MLSIRSIGRRSAILGIICLIFLTASASLYAGSTYFVQNEFTKIEKNNVRNETGVAIDTLQNRINQMAVKNSDWASWDDTYRFIIDRNSAYIQANLINQSLSTLDINFMLFYNAQHHLVWGQGADAQNNTLAIPQQLYNYFNTDSTLFCDKTTDLKTGLLNLPDGALMFAARPILRSDETGPSRGTLIFAEYLSKSEVQGLADLTHLNLQYLRTNQLPASSPQLGQLTSSTTAVQIIGSDQIAGYREINDYFGKPVLVAQVILPRDDFLEAQRSLTYFMISIAFVTLLSIVIALYVSNQVQIRDKTIQLKNDFFSIAAHEIRTPLTAIMGNSSLLLQEYPSKNNLASLEMLSDIYDSSNRLLRIVTNYLDAARLGSGDVPLHVAEVDLRSVVSSVVNETQALAAEHKIFLRSEIPNDLPPAWADEERVKQVMYNLIGNAMKFTEQGGITVGAHVEDKKIRVTVADTGRGISLEAQKMLFNKFKQTGTTDAARGSGLGLYISRMLVELMGGTIAIDSSEVGKGTSISFTIPSTLYVIQQSQIAGKPKKHA